MAVALGCEVARARRLDVRGLRLHFLESGRAGAPVLCFLHGGAAHAHWFDKVTPVLADRFHVIRLINHHFLACWREIDPTGSKHRGLLSLMRRHRHNLKPEQGWHSLSLRRARL